ncbi:MAG: hypothetical protein KZQ83_04400 [gamma proteobacterium symbiont of Taylorina sp.]|nr:hypothetical protein [gamma proteobacterium symbiont of Taylorina sp.]
MLKILIILLSTSLLAPNVFAEKDDAEKLVSSMKKADMTYRQLMEVMVRSSSMMHEGILRENKQMVEVGANFIFTHPAPDHKPWSIMKKEDQVQFKQSLVSFDKILDVHTESIVEASKKENWIEASKAANELMNSCISCHAMWKNKVK